MRILTIRFPPVPIITLGLFAKGTLKYTVKYLTASKDSLQMTLEGDLKASVEVIKGPGSFNKVYAGADGTIISATGSATVTKNDVIKGFNFSGTTVNTWVEAKIKVPIVGQKTLWKKTYKFFDTWSI